MDKAVEDTTYPWPWGDLAREVVDKLYDVIEQYFPPETYKDEDDYNETNGFSGRCADNANFIIEELVRNRKRISDILRSYEQYYKPNSPPPQEVVETSKKALNLGIFDESIKGLIQINQNKIDTKKAKEIFNIILIKWMVIDGTLWVPYEWEKIKDPKILEALTEIALDYCIGAKEMKQILELIEKYQKWIQEQVFGAYGWNEDIKKDKTRNEYSKKENREAITNEVIKEFVDSGFLSDELEFLIDPKDKDREDEESCEIIMERFLKTWLIMDKRIWTGKRLEEILVLDADDKYVLIDPEDYIDEWEQRK